MKKLLLSLLLASVFFVTNSCEKEYECNAGDPDIVGARCNDGSRSSATGSGACSSHGGVDHWICQ